MFLTGTVAAADPAPRLDLHGDPLPPGAIARLGTARLRHAGPVTALAYSPDGKLLAAGAQTPGASSELVLWEMPGGRFVRRFELGGKTPRVAAFSPDGKRLAVSATTDGRGDFYLVDLESEKDLLEERVPASAFAFSADGKRFAAARTGESVGVWELGTDRKPQRFALPGRTVFALAFTDSGGLLALTGETKTVALRDVTAERDLHAWPLATPYAHCAAFSPDLKTVARPDEHAIVLCDAATGKEVRRLEGHGAKPYALAWSADGRRLASSGWDRTVQVWDAGTGKPAREPLAGGCSALAFAPDGKTLAAGGFAGPHAVTLWDLATGKDLVPVGHTGPLRRVMLSPDGTLILTTSGYQPSALLWEASTGRLVRELPGHTYGVAAAAYSPDGGLIATAGWGVDSGLRFWDPATGRLIRRLERRPGELVSLAFSPDGRALASSHNATNDANPIPGRVRLWDPATGELTRELPPHDESTGVAFSPDGRFLALVGRGVRLWDLAAGRPRREFERTARVRAVALSPDGRFLATVRDLCRLWDVATQTELLRLGLTEPVLGVTFAPDGRSVALSGGDGRVRLVSLPTGRDLAVLEGHSAPARPLVFSSDGRRLISGSDDATALVWDVAEPLGRALPASAEAEPDFLAKRWEDLAGAKAEVAYRAMWDLVAASGPAVGMIRDKLPPAEAADPAAVAKLIAELDAGRFAARESAAKRLAAMGPDAEAALRKSLAGNPSAERRRRVEALLERVEREDLPPDHLRALRALSVLELIASPEARRVLDSLAGGAAGAQLTREARAALDRLDRPPGRQ